MSQKWIDEVQEILLEKRGGRMKCQTCLYFLINLDSRLWCYMFKEIVEDCKQYRKDDE